MRSIALICFSFILSALRTYVLPRSWGSFGIASLLAPCMGFFSSPWSCVIVCVLRTVFSLVFFSLNSFFIFVPTLAGSLVLSCESKLVRISLPLICMITFIVHPVGYHGWLYTCYWLIPIGLGFLSPRSIFLRSLASTFTTHAVGSTLFLYTHTTTSSFWHILIAHVWYERLAAALILTLAYYVITYVITNLSTARLERRSPCQNLLPSS